MKVLVLGGTGVISREIVNRLLEQGHDVTVYNRGNRVVPGQEHIRRWTGNKQDSAQFTQDMAKETFDAVIDMISFTAEDAKNTVHALSGRTGHLVFCSSIAAYKRPFGSIPAREVDQERYDNPDFPYAWNKAEMEVYLEQAIREGQGAITVVRPSLTYGVGAANIGVLRQNANIIHRIRQGKPLLMFGDGKNPWSFTFAPDLAKAFVGVLGKTEAFGEMYHATSEQLNVFEDLYLEFGKLLGIEPELVYLPSKILMAAAPNLCAHLYYEKTYAGLFDNSKIRQVVPDFQADIRLEQGLAMILDWWEREAAGLDEEKDRLEDDFIRYEREWTAQISGLYMK
jgi:nucleoside-diphosphate-sugar epimerase